MAAKKKGITKWILGLIGLYILIILMFLFLGFAYSRTYGKDISSNEHIIKSRESIAKAMKDINHQSHDFSNYVQTKLPNSQLVTNIKSPEVLSLNQRTYVDKINIDNNGIAKVQIGSNSFNIKLASISLAPTDSKFYRKNYNGISALIQGTLSGDKHSIVKSNDNRYYVYADNYLVQQKLLALGIAYIDTPNTTPYTQPLLVAEKEAKRYKMNIWQMNNIVNDYKYNYKVEDANERTIPSIMIAKDKHNTSLWENIKSNFS